MSHTLLTMILNSALSDPNISSADRKRLEVNLAFHEAMEDAEMADWERLCMAAEKEQEASKTQTAEIAHSTQARDENAEEGQGNDTGLPHQRVPVRVDSGVDFEGEGEGEGQDEEKAGGKIEPKSTDTVPRRQDDICEYLAKVKREAKERNRPKPDGKPIALLERREGDICAYLESVKRAARERAERGES
ncbi:hypothetical protein K504DRAFT_514723 [Pleomassaria siparia CBS 279.74]|uniref:Uncharacterized protein n=1 Tax=Pleomassaria siparia CBS 279.74 TaxID=1314801 RepID=A0A6G1JY67_9PLEO|nr:hypothetical protein K504DRAFT_514723 [Pleomassaria siparia CBS 279.74]